MTSSDRYLALELPEEQFLMALAQEAAMTDQDVADLEHRLLHGGPEPGLAAAWALVLGRCGHPASISVLSQVRAHLQQHQCFDQAAAVQLAIGLLARTPKGTIEQADSGYRVASKDSFLYVEDSLAAHWHGQERWGPPLRPLWQEPARAASSFAQQSQLLEAASDGYWVEFARPEAPGVALGPAIEGLWLTRAGLALDRSYLKFVRWTQVSSLGRTGGDFSFQVGSEVIRLPTLVGVSGDELENFFNYLRSRAQGS